MPLLFNVKQMPAEWRAAGLDCKLSLHDKLAWFDPYLSGCNIVTCICLCVNPLRYCNLSLRPHPSGNSSVASMKRFPRSCKSHCQTNLDNKLFWKTVQYQFWRQKRRKYTAGLKSGRHYLELTHWIGCLSIGMSSLWYREMTTRRFCKRIQAQQNHRRQDQKKENQHLKWTIIFHFTYYSRTSIIDLESTDLGWFR